MDQSWIDFLRAMDIQTVVDSNKETFTDDFGNVIVNVHRQEDCRPPCTIHSHDCNMLGKLLWRNDRGIFEHICSHGIGHPCSNSLTYDDPGVHGCDGCCHESK